MWLPGSEAQYRLKPAEGYEVQVCIYRYFNRILFFFGQRSFMRNKAQTAVIIMAIKRLLENEVLSCLVTISIEFCFSNFTLSPF